ncbi:hypothetical protein SJ554_22860, partial [Enterobacter asburiae]|nr:hypothetical protein [Enterobacter asburiae]
MLAITLAMMTKLLTLGKLVFSATQAISSFGIVLVSGIFTAFLLAPLAMPDKKERNRKCTLFIAPSRWPRRCCWQAAASRP